jgi:hypothetical protein
VIEPPATEPAASEPAGPGLPAEVILTGTTAAPPPVRALRAGPVGVLFTGGDLRQVRLGETELVRRIYVAVRDLDWNTLPGRIEDLDVTDLGDSFMIRFTRRDAAGAADYRWRAEIEGTPDGVIRYRMLGEARAGFPYAKIGICVHHPVAGYAGQPFRGTAPEGTGMDGTGPDGTAPDGTAPDGTAPDSQVSGRLPDAIGPQIHLEDGTDLPLFDPVSDLEITHASGGVVSFAFAGDLWEMEDQRNWTDASYKSASTPARLGYHHEAHRGQRFDQQVVIRARGFPPPAGPAASGASGPGRADIEVGEVTGLRVPPIGLGCSDPAAGLSLRALGLLRTIAPAHLRVDLNPDSERTEPTLAAAADLARRVGCALELAVFLPGPGGTAGGQGTPGPFGNPLARLRNAVASARPPLARVLAFSDAEESSSPVTVQAVRAALAEAGVAGPVLVIGGTNVYFNELNRHRIPPGPADGLAWSVNPQIHAFDDLSLMENLQAQPDTVATARSFAPGARLFVTPITLRPRFNAVATTDEDFPSGGLLWQLDPRQPSLFAAAWTLGSAAALSGAGVDGLTYYDTVGPRGVIEHSDGSPDPAAFRSRPDLAYPLALVLADLCGLEGGEIREVAGADPAVLTVLAVSGVSGGSGAVVMIGNLTRDEQQVRVRVPGADAARGADRVRIRLLDQHTLERAIMDPKGFLRDGEERALRGGTATVTLHPYGVARLDIHHE